METKRFNDIRNLVKGNVHQPREEEPTTTSTEPTTEKLVKDHDLDLDPELVQKLDTLRNNRRKGRPRKGEGGRTEHPRATFIIPTELIRKLKYIALVDTRLYSTVVQEALAQYIEEWERNNQVITLK